MARPRKRASGNLTIRQLEVFSVASRSETFSGAARRLGISQPSLSNMIGKIESLLEISLFDRTTRSLALTLEGEKLAIVARDLVKNFQSSLSMVREAADRRQGSLSMAVLPAMASSIAPQAISLFLLRYPDFRIALHDVGRQDGISLVIERAVDFGMLSDTPNVSELHCEQVYVDDYQVICRSDSPIAGRKYMGWQELAQLPFILAGATRVRRDIEVAWTGAGVLISPRFEVEHIATGLSLVAAGLGVTILPGMHAPTAVRHSLCSVPLLDSGLSRQVELVRRSDRVLTKPVEHMIGCFRRVLAEFGQGLVKPLRVRQVRVRR